MEMLAGGLSVVRQALDGFAGFAWPWAWALLPLPVLFAAIASLARGHLGGLLGNAAGRGRRPRGCGYTRHACSNSTQLHACNNPSG